MSEKLKGGGKRGSQVWKGVMHKVKFGRTKEYQLIRRGLFPGEDQIEDIVAKVKHANVVTPTGLAGEFDLRVSTCRRMLAFMQDEGVVRETGCSCSDMRIYEPVER